MRVLLIGDVVSQPGCDFLRSRLPRLKQQMEIDVVIANGENSAVGNGILPHSANFLLDSGVDVVTTGNHIYKRREIYSYLEETPQVIRPANFPVDCPGNGYYIYDGGSFQMLVINLLGTSFLEPLENPFVTVERILSQVKTKYTVVDFHAEATGEKRAFGFFLDGRVSIVVGTHTHVQTSDDQVLPKGTGYITDLGMTGPYHSVLGAAPESIIQRLTTHMPTRYEVRESPCVMEGAVFSLNETTGLCDRAEGIRIYESELERGVTQW
jgi:metallophosphoesterase (TIGR00282 family)